MARVRGRHGLGNVVAWERGDMQNVRGCGMAVKRGSRCVCREGHCRQQRQPRTGTHMVGKEKEGRWHVTMSIKGWVGAGERWQEGRHPKGMCVNYRIPKACMHGRQ